MKKTLAIVLALAMVLCMIPVSFAAASVDAGELDLTIEIVTPNGNQYLTSKDDTNTITAEYNYEKLSEVTTGKFTEDKIMALVKVSGLLKMDSLAEDTVRFPDPLLRQAAHLVAEVSGADRVRKVLYNYILAGGIQSPQKLLNGIIIAEGMVAIGEGEDLDYIFTYLIPSYFGIDYHETVHEIYLRYKKERFANRSAKDES